MEGKCQIVSRYHRIILKEILQYIQVFLPAAFDATVPVLRPLIILNAFFN